MPKTIKQISAHITCAVIVFALAFCMPASTIAQSTAKLKHRADACFANRDYYTALKLYNVILYDSPLVTKTNTWVYPFRPVNHSTARKIKPSKRPYFLYRLAESYRLCYHYKEALPQYEQYISSQDTQFPLARLWYGLCLLAGNEPEKAITALNGFLQKYKTVDSFAQKARMGIANSHFAIGQKSLPVKVAITKIPSTVSSDGSNFALEKMNDSSFWFTTSRHEMDKRKELIYPVRLYSGNLNDKTSWKIKGFPDSTLNMATSSLSADGLTLFFTGWKEDAALKQVNYRIFYTTRTSPGSAWTAPVAMPASVNVAGFNAKQPFLTKDNRHLLFVSDRPGGFGKYDIWMVDMDGTTPLGAAVNPGTGVNTAEDEVSPFYDAATGNLYFSSNGRTGMGGLDIYRIKTDLSADQWAGQAMNLGYPVNSVKDDEYYTRDAHSDTAYLSSDRASVCCMEIFKVVPVPQKDSSGKAGKERVVVPLPEKPAENTAAIKDQNKALMDSVNAITVDRLHVNYHFASARIRKADHPQLDSIVKMLHQNPALNILVASFTDCIGSMSANNKLSRKRSGSVKAYLVGRGIKGSRINIDFFGKKHLIVACKEDNSYDLEKQMANRRSDLIVTTEKNPKWQPSGKELDIQQGPSGYPLKPIRDLSLEELKKPGNNATNSKTGNAAASNKPDSNSVVLLANPALDGSKKSANNNDVKTDKNENVTGVNKAATNPVLSLGNPVIDGTKKSTGNNDVKTDKNKPITEANQSAVNPVVSSGNTALPDGSKKSDSASNATRWNKTTGNSKESSQHSKYITDKPDNGLANNRRNAPAPEDKRKAARNKKVQEASQGITVKAIPVPYQNPAAGKLSDSMPGKIKITTLLDMTPRLQKPGIIDRMTSRMPKKSFEVFTESDSVKVELYDNGVFDYDTVSVIYNKTLVAYKQMLQTNKPISFYVKLNPDLRKNEMIFFAENLGLTPPNSALMIITDGDKKRTEINVSSDLEHNSVIYFIKVKK